MISLELLAPAKNLEYGRAAIDCGADAVYIGALQFGARKAAGNTLNDIAALVRYAHLYKVKVYVAVNTIIYEDEISEVEKLVHDLYNMGVDAIIVQDMAFGKMKLPPIELHASTQTTNIDVDHIVGLSNMGFSRVILERAISLDKINEVRSKTDVELEAFIHGAICISHSGNCYLSEYVSSRSANRGECSQPCRSKYNLYDENNEIVFRNRHLLSLKDLSYEDYIDKLADSGVTSFKIEGRLKDIVYLRNSVAKYSDILDRIVAQSGGKYVRSSEGICTRSFIPDLAKGFSRGFTNYYIDYKQKGVVSWQTGKSIGEYIGVVKKVASDAFFLDKDHVKVSNGDGICFFSSSGEFGGTNINIVEGNKIVPQKIENIAVGTKIYRNFDRIFNLAVENCKAIREIPIVVKVLFTENKITFSSFDSLCGVVTYSPDMSFEKANNVERARENIINSIKKSGDTIFKIDEVDIEGEPLFIPTSVANSLRREFLSKIEDLRLKSYKRNVGVRLSPVTIKNEISYKYNVANSYAKQFYNECGVKYLDDAVEITHNFKNVELMRTSYCLRREIGCCLKESNFKYKKLTLENNGRYFDLEFDCVRCEMIIKKSNAK